MAVYPGIPRDNYERLKTSASEYMWGQLDPLAEDWDEAGKLPRDKLWPEFRNHGFWGLVVSQEYGGLGLNITQMKYFVLGVEGGPGFILWSDYTSEDFENDLFNHFWYFRLNMFVKFTF